MSARSVNPGWNTDFDNFPALLKLDFGIKYNPIAKLRSIVPSGCAKQGAPSRTPANTQVVSGNIFCGEETALETVVLVC